MTSPIPLLWRLVALAACGLAIWLLGWMQGQASSLQGQHTADLARERAVGAQVLHVQKTEAAQAAESNKVAHDVETRIAAVHRYYADRLRQQPAAVHPSPVPGAADPAGSADATSPDPGSPPSGGGIRAESYDALAERCAVTTAVAMGWQIWWGRVTDPDSIGFDVHHNASPLTRRDGQKHSLMDLSDPKQEKPPY